MLTAIACVLVLLSVGFVEHRLRLATARFESRSDAQRGGLAQHATVVAKATSLACLSGAAAYAVANLISLGFGDQGLFLKSFAVAVAGVVAGSRFIGVFQSHYGQAKGIPA